MDEALFWTPCPLDWVTDALGYPSNGRPINHANPGIKNSRALLEANVELPYVSRTKMYELSNSPGKIRTCDQSVNSRPLYH
jgi:hypothetical protein